VSDPLLGVSPLVDTLGRVHTDLRISVTDRCNLRCFYCMPPDGVEFRPHDAILSFEEIARFVRAAVGLGIRKLRLTGGEPLVRKGICDLVRLLAAIPGVEDLAMTTNAVLLAEFAQPLRDAGLQRLNISLDALDRETYQRISRRDDLGRALDGIAAARDAGFREIKLNAVPIRGLTEDQVVPLARYARASNVELRLIEFMPADGRGCWTSEQVLSGEEILSRLTEGICPLEPLAEPDSAAPAVRYRFVDGCGTIGLINTVSEPFCQRCSRLRLTSEGLLRNCIFSQDRWDVRGLLRGGGNDRQVAETIREAVRAKKPRHGTDEGILGPTDRGMYQIGG
jgi:cyclic pyranopterin phosphate synthase